MKKQQNSFSNNLLTLFFDTSGLFLTKVFFQKLFLFSVVFFGFCFTFPFLNNFDVFLLSFGPDYRYFFSICWKETLKPFLFFCTHFSRFQNFKLKRTKEKSQGLLKLNLLFVDSLRGFGGSRIFWVRESLL